MKDPYIQSLGINRFWGEMREDKTKTMNKITYGSGTIRTQQGEIEGEGKCLMIKDTGIAHPIGSTEKKWDKIVQQDSQDIILVFKNLESARSFQDEINELCATWSREINPKV